MQLNMFILFELGFYHGVLSQYFFKQLQIKEATDQITNFNLSYHSFIQVSRYIRILCNSQERLDSWIMVPYVSTDHWIKLCILLFCNKGAICKNHCTWLRHCINSQPFHALDRETLPKWCIIHVRSKYFVTHWLSESIRILQQTDV